MRCGGKNKASAAKGVIDGYDIFSDALEGEAQMLSDIALTVSCIFGDWQ